MKKKLSKPTLFALSLIYTVILFFTTLTALNTSYSMGIDGFAFNREEYMDMETATYFEDVDRDGMFETLLVFYERVDQPSMIARFFRGNKKHNAYWLAVDLDNNDKGDFSMVDIDSDGYLDIESLKCFENCKELEAKMDDISKGIFKLDSRI